MLFDSALDILTAYPPLRGVSRGLFVHQGGGRYVWVQVSRTGYAGRTFRREQIRR